MDAETRERLVARVTRGMRAWADENPWCNTQGVMDDEWLEMAAAVVDALGIEETDGWETFTADDGGPSLRVRDDLFRIRAAGDVS